METLVVASAAFIMSPFVLGGLLLATILFAHNEWDGILGFTLFILAVSAVIIFPFKYILVGLVAYIPSGIMYSRFSWKRFLRIEWTRAKKLQRENQTHESVVLNFESAYSVKKYAGQIVFWILTWPMQLIANIFGDAIEYMVTLVKTKLAVFYSKIVDDVTKT